MLYKKNLEKTLSKELFKNPTSEYRGTPFWAWNDYLTKEELNIIIELICQEQLLHMIPKDKYETEKYNLLESLKSKIKTV